MSMKPFFYSLIVSCFFAACNKDRVAPDGFVPIDEFYERHQEEEQVFVIESDTGGCLTGEKFTLVCPARQDLTLNGDSVELPYALHLTELYGISDYILNKASSVYNGGGVLYTPAMIDIATYKDEESLSLREGRSMYVKLPLENQPEGLNVFQTGQWEDFNGWQDVAGQSAINQDDNGFYEMWLANQTWSSAGTIRSEETTTITFDIDASGTEHIQLYAVVKDYEAVIRGHNLVIEDVPLNEEISVVAFAYDTNDQYRLFYTDREPGGEITIDLNFNVVSEDELLNFISGL